MDPSIIIIIAVLIISIVIHEVSHGYAANWLGDPTARLAGRLTLNPIHHIDPVGSVLLPALLVFSGAGILFGWAKPVPYNPYNLKNQRWGEAIVAVAGPGVNLLIALIFGLLIRFSAPLGLDSSFLEIAGFVVYINILLALFNMIPIPPLDGSKVLASILPYNLETKYRAFSAAFERYGFFATFAFIFIFIFLLWQPFSKLIFAVFQLFTGLSGL